MKKFISLLIIIFAVGTTVFAQEEYTSINNTNRTSQTTVNGDFFDVLPHFISSNLVIYLGDVDTVLRGKLIAVYKDGLVIKTAFGQSLFVSRKSIAYAEIKHAQESEIGRAHV